MTFPRLVLIVALLGFGAHWWKQRSEAAAMTRVTDPYGFVPVPMPAGFENDDSVLIFAPDNCPKEGAQRAAAISAGLTAQGIPNVRTSRYEAQAFEPTHENLASYKRLDTVMTGEIPIVLVNGRGKANATLEDVVAEYNHTKRE